ncbi:9482_t:CDS:1 [Funneliformis geosporum]|uniref:1461_t:CDS:1 n=1 Tax=Funneliformis geosporum TaxID=1117311 RepID=A0A9W4SYE3_9GLOM|nr:1461_t:CDS:1 [Funneliformis geosporum]CAI2193045.1 9482_t:CDS:1 [Funneliformis geosporum]
MFNSQRNNINGQYFSQSTELLNHPNHRTTINNTESTPSTRQNSTSSTNQIARLVRRLVNGNLSRSNTSSSRSQTTRTQVQDASTSTPTSSTHPTVPNSTSASLTESTNSEAFLFHNPWSIPEFTPSYVIRPAFSRSSRPSRPTRHTQSSTPPTNAIREYYNIIPFQNSYSNNNNNPSSRRLSNSSMEQQSPAIISSQTASHNSYNNNFHDPLNYHQYLIQNHTSREAFCLLSNRSSYLNENEVFEDDSFSSERNSNENECEIQQKQQSEECYLCLEPLELRGGRMIINPGCGHLIHMKCYLEYTKYFKQQCTLCKKDFGNWDN